MKRVDIIRSLIVLAGIFILVAVIGKIEHRPGSRNLKETNATPRTLGKVGLLAMMAGYQHMKLADPLTGKIPTGIRARELAFVNGPVRKFISTGQEWHPRGPSNIGGRMLCIAVDLENEEHLLAGSASGGMWASQDQGMNWSKTTSPDAEQSATCVIQDCRKGKRNTWYYGTGELLSTTDRNVSTNARTIGTGSGIFKSTDNGATWFPLASTQGGDPGHLSEIFQGVWRLATDPVRMDRDIVYAACYGAIMRSEDGGLHWDVVLGDMENKSFCTDVVVTAEGVIYAALSSFCMAVEPPGKAGIWRSEDGITWEKITPAGFPNDNRVTRLALAPSNGNVMYVFTESQAPNLNPFNGYANTVNTFWKMTWNKQADSAVWENRTMGMPGHGNGEIDNFPFSMVVYGGYTFTMGVKPDDENVVFMGGMNMHRSENGFADSLQTTYVGGYPYDMDSVNQLHPDQHGIVFLPSDPKIMFLSNDGGIYRTDNCLADSADMSWHRLNNKLTTTQFYSVAIDHGKSGDDWILGGLQDNNWYYTVTNDPSELWFDIDICYDGFATALARNWEFAAISAYSGNIWTCRFDPGMHAMDIFPQLPDTLLKYYDPGMGSNILFPFYQNLALDPVTNETFYLPTVSSIWRKDNMKAAAYDSSLRNVGWSHMSNINTGSAAEISYLALSVVPANRLYYGTSLGRLYRVDHANQGNPVPVEVTGDNFPTNAFISYIDVDPLDADKLIIAFSNYGVKSLFSSVDGGASWTHVSGNLEESADGSGSGPSVRCIKKLTFSGATVYFAGTTTGLFSTRELEGDSTTWTREGINTIGNVMVDDIDVRSTDGFIAIGTHGNGVYSTYFDPSAGIPESRADAGFTIGNIFPDPVSDFCRININAGHSVSFHVEVFSAAGKLIKIFPVGVTRGSRTIELALPELAPGIYYLSVNGDGKRLLRKFIKV